VDLTYQPDAEEFRREVRSWLESNFTTEGADLRGERRAFSKSWVAKLRSGGWLCASWPEEYGGRGLSPLHQAVLSEEFARVGAPMTADFFGDTLVGPTILRWGSEEQKRHFLPRIRNGEITWCQGFSEPQAGSDLASLQTTAELSGDEWVVNGHKLWTTQADRADYMFLLARTDPYQSKHAGISFLLLPMRQPGVEVRPIKQMDTSSAFFEVLMTDARCHRDNLVGGLNNGWKVAMTTLELERGTSLTINHLRVLKELNRVIEVARSNGRIADPLVRQRLAASWTKVKLMEIGGYRHLTSRLRRDNSTAALAATNKMFWSEYHQEAMDLAMDILGMDGQVLSGSDSDRLILGPGLRRGSPEYPVSALQASFFFSRSETIWGGTSEIQRSIVGERVLGLPKEPKPSAQEG
jgi:alkylation response protein AidB-like acyl-CoA dehydrogenase